MVERSKRPLTPAEVAPRPKPDSARVEASVIAALRLGDVQKALQMLNSAPIAPKNETEGDNPAPMHIMMS